ncbi:NmrA family NAD(P)-binding protein [Pseudonocardia humida]|uniref:NAD(P)H-binding protein n=1 Tax=Pseudonocardia humida TaxID=2800819 RepID=A0ABT0ZWS7_9PSEU|nr:NAD(P)H-binding protein [Pseudonocardia humida]MCO1655109.1 NAD(P)H-binding protein [Pseudonocardia humida]
MNRNTVLVTGATGTVGRHLVAELRRRGTDVRALVRDPQRAAGIIGPDVELAVGDFADPASLRAALPGVHRVHLACANHPDQVAWETAMIDAAAAAGVGRIVKLSALDARIGSPVAFADAHGRVERHLLAAGVPHVLLKPTFAMTNLLAAADSVRQAGAILLPGSGAKIAMIDPRDVAAVAAVALTTDGHDGRAYELTGPAAVTFDEVAAQLSTLLDRPVGFVPVPDDAALGQLVGAGAPQWYAAGVVAQFGLLRAGTQADVRDVVRVLTGREPRSLAQFLGEHAAAFGDR